MNRSCYSASIDNFLTTSPDAILGELTRASEFSVDQTQAVAWIEQIHLKAHPAIVRPDTAG